MVNWAKTSLQVQRPIGEGLLWHLKRLLDSLLNLLKLEPEFWIYGLVRVLGPVGHKLILPPQIPRWRFMLTFEELECDSTLDLGQNEILFVTIGAKILDLWLDKNLGLNWPKCSYNATDPWMKIDFDIWRVHQIHLLVLDIMRHSFENCSKVSGFMVW